jgi:hypothetical protein
MAEARAYPSDLHKGHSPLWDPMYDIGSAIDIFCLCCQFEHSQKITPVLPIGFLKGLRVLT